MPCSLRKRLNLARSALAASLFYTAELRDDEMMVQAAFTYTLLLMTLHGCHHFICVGLKQFHFQTNGLL